MYLTFHAHPMMAVSSPRRFARQLLLLTFILSSLLSPIVARDCPHGGGLWGSVKDSVEPIARPVLDSVGSKYNGLSDKGRFLAGACAGFGASRLAVRTTLKTAKTVGAAYIAFEALEYAGILKDARLEKHQKSLAQARDYVLRTVDGIRHDLRTQLNPEKISSRVKRSMERDKSGTVGFGTGAFLGFIL
mmetsp:Transcript_32418/g.69030  ORF Transcript_32418/g.69030 Transcript_32418/m.69030 type:complete len:189 (-) Transcript_32418:7-573(-)